MSYKSFTSTELTQRITSLVFSFIFGLLALTGTFVMYDKWSSALENRSKAEEMGELTKMWLHTYDGLDFTVPGKEIVGTFRMCASVMNEDYSAGIARDVTPDSQRINGPFCKNMFNQMHSWEKNAQSPSKTKKWFAGNILYSVILIALFALTFKMVFTIPGNLATLATGLRPVGWIINAIVFIPFLFGIVVFLRAGWIDQPTSWKTAEGHTVVITPVYMDNNGNLFKAPRTMYEWSDTYTLTPLKMNGGNWNK